MRTASLATRGALEARTTELDQRFCAGAAARTQPAGHPGEGHPVDGPGQGEAEYQFPIRGDYEVAVTAVVGWLAGRGDVDPARVGL